MAVTRSRSSSVVGDKVLRADRACSRILRLAWQTCIPAEQSSLACPGGSSVPTVAVRVRTQKRMCASVVDVMARAPLSRNTRSSRECLQMCR